MSVPWAIDLGLGDGLGLDAHDLQLHVLGDRVSGLGVQLVVLAQGELGFGERVGNGLCGGVQLLGLAVGLDRHVLGSGNVDRGGQRGQGQCRPWSICAFSERSSWSMTSATVRPVVCTTRSTPSMLTLTSLLRLISISAPSATGASSAGVTSSSSPSGDRGVLQDIGHGGGAGGDGLALAVNGHGDGLAATDEHDQTEDQRGQNGCLRADFHPAILEGILHRIPNLGLSRARGQQCHTVGERLPRRKPGAAHRVLIGWCEHNPILFHLIDVCMRRIMHCRRQNQMHPGTFPDPGY